VVELDKKMAIRCEDKGHIQNDGPGIALALLHAVTGMFGLGLRLDHRDGDGLGVRDDIDA